MTNIDEEAPTYEGVSTIYSIIEGAGAGLLNHIDSSKVICIFAAFDNSQFVRAPFNSAK